jgi:competence protein ComEC
MLHWLRYPFIRFTPAFIAGIIFFEALGNPEISDSASLAFVGFFLLLILISISKKFFSLNPVAGGSSLIIFFLAGFVLSGSHYQLSSPNHFSHNSFTHYYGVVDSWPEERENFYRFILSVDYVKDSKWKKAKGKIQVYYPKNDVNSVSYGSMLLIKSLPAEIRGPRNPGEFNYKKYLARKNIFHQQFLKEGDYKFSGIQYPNRLKAYAGLLRNKANTVLSQYLKFSDRLSIARAMILGIRTDMDDEMRTAYANAGAMHILAISGLHVGIIYGFLALLLAPLRNTRKGKYIFTIVILSILWAYALLVGMSPSVMRASVMFSLIAIGQAFYRTPDIFNTIAFSALLLLIINPFQLFEVGFQSSWNHLDFQKCK